MADRLEVHSNKFRHLFNDQVRCPDAHKRINFGLMRLKLPKNAFLFEQ